VGRIPVNDVDQAWQVVNKIIAYEKTPPPTTSSFYQNASVLAQFQCCRYDNQFKGESFTGYDQRTFVQTAEFVRDLLQGHGKTVERIYTKEIDPYYPHPSATPSHYNDETDLPPDLGPKSGFAWDGSRQDVVSAFNDGRFLILQRDHGSWLGWKSWSFTRDDVDSLTNNNLLPVVFSMNCSTALFDNETNPGELRILDNNNPFPSPSNPPIGTGPGTEKETYFAERLVLKKDGGAVGVIGATRDSSSWPNDVLTRGVFDAIWPDAIPTFGDVTSKRRLGDILNHGKVYLLTQTGPETGWEQFWFDELFLYHVIGDPTLEMWTSQVMTLVADHTLEVLEKMLRVRYPIEGATITALQNTDDGLAPIGRATVKNGEAILNYVVPPQPGSPILLSVSKANAVSRLLTPSGGDVR
jgi:hypothetical protein